MCAEQLVPSRQIAAATAGCVSFGADCCIAASVPSAFLSPILPSAVAASSCSGPSSLAISISLGTAVGDLVVADRLDHGAAEEVDAAHRRRESAPRRPSGPCGIAASARTSAGRTNSPSSFSSAASSFGASAGSRILLEVARRPLRAGDRSARPSPRPSRRSVRGSLKPVSSVSALKRTKPSACSLTACSSAGHRLRRRRAANRARRPPCASGSRDRRACRSPRGSVRARSASGRAPARTQEQITNNEQRSNESDERASHLADRFGFFFRERLALAVDLQRQLQVAAFIARERHRIVAGVARRAVRRALGLHRRRAARRG